METVLINWSLFNYEKTKGGRLNWWNLHKCNKLMKMTKLSRDLYWSKVISRSQKQKNKAPVLDGRLSTCFYMGRTLTSHGAYQTAVWGHSNLDTRQFWDQSYSIAPVARYYFFHSSAQHIFRLCKYDFIFTEINYQKEVFKRTSVQKSCLRYGNLVSNLWQYASLMIRICRSFQNMH